MPVSCILLLPLDSLVHARRKHLVFFLSGTPGCVKPWFSSFLFPYAILIARNKSRKLSYTENEAWWTLKHRSETILSIRNFVRKTKNCMNIKGYGTWWRQDSAFPTKKYRTVTWSEEIQQLTKAWHSTHVYASTTATANLSTVSLEANWSTKHNVIKLWRNALCWGSSPAEQHNNLSKLDQTKGPHTFSGRNSLLMFSWNESTRLSPAPYWCSITWTSLEYSSKTWGLEVSPRIPARRNSMHCLCLFVGPVTNCSGGSPFAGHVLLSQSSRLWPGIELRIWIQMTRKGSLPFKCFQRKVNWTNLTISGLMAAMICTVTCSISTCQHASASRQTWFFLNRSGSIELEKFLQQRCLQALLCQCDISQDAMKPPMITEGHDSQQTLLIQLANKMHIKAFHIKRWIFFPCSCQEHVRHTKHAQLHSCEHQSAFFVSPMFGLQFDFFHTILSTRYMLWSCSIYI